MRELEFAGALATIMSVEVSRDLNKAIIKLGVLPSEKADEVLSALNRDRNNLQHLLLKKINIKPMPKIIFEIDLIRFRSKSSMNFVEALKKTAGRLK